MIKLVINSPKGGVGKTTTATNIALLLANKGHRVMAVDLAGGLLMSRALYSFKEFAPDNNNVIVQEEANAIPEEFDGASNYDYAVIDTDDSFTVSKDLLLGLRPSWKVISPVIPNDNTGLTRIPHEIRAVALAALLKSSKLSLSIVANMAYGGDSNDGYERLCQVLENYSIKSLLSRTILPFGKSRLKPPLLLDDDRYLSALMGLLQELGLNV